MPLLSDFEGLCLESFGAVASKIDASAKIKFSNAGLSLSQLLVGGCIQWRDFQRDVRFAILYRHLNTGDLEPAGCAPNLIAPAGGR